MIGAGGRTRGLGAWNRKAKMEERGAALSLGVVDLNYESVHIKKEKKYREKPTH